MHPQGTGRGTPGHPRTKRQADLLMWIVWLCFLGQVQSFTLEYQDCRNPTRLEHFMEKTACTADHTPAEQPGEKTYAVLTEAPTQELDGWSCEMRKTEWQYQCEPSSQLWLATLPYIRTHVQLTMEECRNMTLHRKYQPPGQDKILHLRTGEWSYFKVDQEGQLLEDQGLLRCPEGGHGPKSHPAPPSHLLI